MTAVVMTMDDDNKHRVALGQAVRAFYLHPKPVEGGDASVNRIDAACKAYHQTRSLLDSGGFDAARVFGVPVVAPRMNIITFDEGGGP
jgi:hypothetical protein